MRKLGVQKKLRGDAIKISDPNRPKGYSTLYDIMLRNKAKPKKEKGVRMPKKYYAS